jgi:hypothetical protein
MLTSYIINTDNKKECKKILKEEGFENWKYNDNYFSVNIISNINNLFGLKYIEINSYSIFQE